MRVSSSNFRIPLESRRREQANIRSTLLMLVLFLVGMAVGASGMASTKTVVLLTPAEIDRAAQNQVNYPAPGT